MLRRLDNLDGRIIANLWLVARRERDLRETECTVVLLVRGPCDLEDGNHGVREIEWLVAEAHIDVEHGLSVTWEPSGLNGYRAAF